MATLSKLEQPEQILIHSDHPSLVFIKTRRIDSSGYFNIHKSGRYFKEHRVIWEAYNKACLLSWSHVHHKNGNRQDNRIENLEAMTKAQHSRLHFNPYQTKGLRYHWKSDAIGRTKTEEHKRRIGDALRGKPKSELHKANIKKHHWRLKSRS